jgi:hypothetical protein
MQCDGSKMNASQESLTKNARSASKTRGRDITISAPSGNQKNEVIKLKFGGGDRDRYKSDRLPFQVSINKIAKTPSEPVSYPDDSNTHQRHDPSDHQHIGVDDIYAQQQHEADLYQHPPSYFWNGPPMTSSGLINRQEQIRTYL